MAEPTFPQPDSYQRNPLPGDLKLYTFEIDINGAKKLFEWDGPARQLRDVTDNVPTDPIAAEVRYPGQGQLYYVAADGNVMQDRTIRKLSKNKAYDLDLVYASNGMIYGDAKDRVTGESFDVEERSLAPAAELHVFYPYGDHVEPVIRLDVVEFTNQRSKGQDQEVTGYPLRTELKPTSVRDINTFAVQPAANTATTESK